MRTKINCFILWSLLLMILLCGCGKQDFQPEQVCEYYAERAFSAQYTVTTHAGFYTAYQLSCDSRDGVSDVTILQPASVAGIHARLQNGDIKLQYEEISLDALLPEVPGYAPMDMLHGILEDLRSQFPENHSRETDCLSLEYKEILSDGTETLKIIKLNPETLDLQTAECYLDGSLILALQIETMEWLA